VLHMSVAQLQACHRLTDGRLQRYGQSGVQSVLFKAAGQDKSLLSMSSCFNRKKRNRF
jgi:hypothetical protein